MATRQGGPAAESRPTRDFRAAVTFLTATLFAGLAAVAAFPEPLEPPVAHTFAVVGAVASATALGAAAIGLATGRGWAAAAMTPVLWIMLSAAIVSFASALGRGAFELSIIGVLAIWSLTARPREARNAASLTMGSIVLVGVVAVTAAWPVVSTHALRPGGPLIVSAEALLPTLRIEGGCFEAGGVPPAPPATVDIVFAWSWDRRPLAAGSDAIVIDWFTMPGDGVPGYRLAAVPAGITGVWEANRGTGDDSGVVLGVDLGVRGVEPGEVWVTLAPPQSGPTQHGSIDVYARYLHAPQQIDDPQAAATWSRLVQARCEW